MDSVRNDLIGKNASLQASGADRAAALAEARQKLQRDGLRAAQSAQEARAELTAAARDAIARAIGANTRLSIERTEANDVFVYRAIDNQTGEIVNEWPPHQFAELLKQAQAGAEIDLDAVARGAIIDQEA